MYKAKIAASVIAAVSLAIVSAGAVSVLWLYRHEPATIRLVDRPAAIERHRPMVPNVPHYVGVFMDGESTSLRALQHFSKVEGRKPNITVYYDSWGASFNRHFFAKASKAGMSVVMQLTPGPYSVAAIAAGHGDRYLRHLAAQVRRYRHRVIISWAPEADTRAHAWGWHRTPAAKWVASWKHVVKLFRRAGARNVTWLWDMSGGKYTASRVRAYWPGSQYVNWIGVNAYFISPARTYQFVVGDVVRAIRRFAHKPIILPEVGIGPKAGQAAKLPSLFAGIRHDHLLGLIWFDLKQHQGINHQDWRLDGHHAAVAAFQAGVRSLGRLAP